MQFREIRTLFTEVVMETQVKDQGLEAERIYEALHAGCEVELRQIAQLLASKPDHQLFGKTEFELRDIVLNIGAKALETALEERKKGGTKDPA
jgi:hypothetical protein